MEKEYKMRIILLIPSDHIYAHFVIKELLKRRAKDIVLMVESSILVPGSSFFYSLKQYLCTSGIRYVLAQVSKQLLFKVGSFLMVLTKKEASLFYPYKRMARKLNIQVITSNEINNEELVKLFKKLTPDIIISLYFKQILRREVLNIPKVGCLNLHPAKLPYYRGISPVFWALANGEGEVGISLHFMTEKIDAGSIVSQRMVQVEDRDTEHSLFLKCTKIGTEMLLQIMNRIENNIPLNPIKQRTKEGSYFSLPTRKAVREFKERGRNFFFWRELLLPFFKHYE